MKVRFSLYTYEDTVKTLFRKPYQIISTKILQKPNRLHEICFNPSMMPSLISHHFGTKKRINPPKIHLLIINQLELDAILHVIAVP